MLKNLAAGWLPACLLAVACTPDNKVAEELDRVDTGDTDSSSASEQETDDTTDSASDSACRAGGGAQPCSAVSACETGCRTNTICLGECRESLCTAHESMYCDMVECIGNHCGEFCEDLSDTDCLVCISFYCATETALCSTAISCEDDTSQGE